MIKIRDKILLCFLAIIVFMSVFIALYGYFVVNTYIVGEAQKQVKADLQTVRRVYYDKVSFIKTSFDLFQDTNELDSIKDKLGLDYLYKVGKADLSDIKSDIVKEVLKTGKAIGAIRILEKDELLKMNKPISIVIKETPRARPTTRKVLESALSFEYAKPYFDDKGAIEGVIYGGKLINNNFALIDDIVNTVFENKMYDGKPIGTVTIFLDDVRIVTNVLDKEGQRAIGTRVSAEVYKKVVEEKGSWFHRAFVVTDWYITAYEPIKDIKGNIIGSMYVGILEKPFMKIRRDMFFTLLMIIGISSIPAIGLSYFITNSIAQPLVHIIEKTNKISGGELKSRVETKTTVKELNALIESFNNMTDKLQEREKSLAVSNERLSVMNNRYLELIGFVSHELKGILSSLVLNVYMLKNEILGSINTEQKKTLMSVSKNLDYLTVTVKNFLSLSRVEKEELEVSKTELLLKEHIFDPAIEAFIQQAEEKNIQIVNNMQGNIKMMGDSGLLQIVANNLISNAVKYGKPKGKLEINSQIINGEIEVEVYNDGEPIASVDVDKLFRKFSRVIYRGMEKVKGTGIGLFISKEIIVRHGGTIWVEPKPQGNSFKFKINLS